jgi:DNA modification methylase/superfamily II DNA or RNA helicase
MKDLNYDQFIMEKSRRHQSSGFNPKPFTVPLFDWQESVVAWAIKKGKAALFEDCGLGKTAQQLEFADQVSKFTKLPVIILTPLSVARQTLREAEKFGISAKVVDSASQIGEGVYISNYEKLDHFDSVNFGGVVLDESSILKSFTGKTRKRLTERFSDTPYRLCCTATPSPNDYTEFGQHADFLGVCSPAQMLCTYFINDTFNTGDWRLKKHAEEEFWKWVSSWAACISKPSDIGFEDGGYNLPKLNLEKVIVDVDEVQGAGDGELFRNATLSATTMHKEMRLTAPRRVEEVASLVNNSDEPWVVWCNTNDESERLAKAIPCAVEIRGSDTAKKKEQAAEDFVDGKIRVLISKSGIFGYGMNWQHCRNVAFVGLSYSFEDFYQALRRVYRFGQKQDVNAYVIHAATEGPIMATIARKIKQHEDMQENMKIAAKEMKAGTKQLEMRTEIEKAEGDNWTVYHGDCVRVAKEIPDQSIDFSVFSPPFADLFTYSDDLQDMGNCNDLEDFTAHFEILIKELKRIMVPGREVAVHCVDLLSTKWKSGRIEFQDFSGEIIRAFWRHGFLFHSRICIWKSPVTEMQRTKAHGLLHKTLKTDSSSSRVGCADYLLVFRNGMESTKPVVKDGSKYPVSWWQEVASPVWMTVDQGRVLNKDGARDHKDEKHICPLQLDVIERAVELWSNPGDLVYSPFTGIGSEGYGALSLGRKFIGSELKESYFNQACQNLTGAGAQLEFSLA